MGNKEGKQEAIPSEQMLLYSELAPDLEKFSVADLCFVCDVTGSMSSHMAKVKDALLEFAKVVFSTMSYKPRLAFIGFRDRDSKEQLVVKNFTKDVDEMTNFISKIVCSGEGDECEDVVAPLMELLKLDWRSDIKRVYLIIDAPTHGKAYHPNTTFEISDDYPKEDEKKMLEKLCCHLRRNKVVLTVIRCRWIVDDMVKIMAKWFTSKVSELNIINLCGSTGSQLAMGVKESFGTTLAKDFVNTTFKDYKVETQIFGRSAGVSCPEPDPKVWMQKFKALKYTCYINNGPFYESGKYEYSFGVELTQTDEQNFSIASTAFGTGKFCDCRYLNVDGDANKYVAKITKCTIKDLAEISTSAECYLVAQLFARAFCDELGKGDSINVPSLLILKLQSKEYSSIFGGSKFVLAQEYIAGEYIKYNNNCGWVPDGNSDPWKLAQAFSHFTYEHSNGALIIVDIQGVWDEGTQRFLLTDPAIHSIYHKKNYGLTDLGKLGVIRFFKTHKCNDFCKKLKLVEVTMGELKTIDDGLKLKYEECKISSKFKPAYDKTMDGVFDKWKIKFSNFDPAKEPALATPEEENQLPLSASVTGICSSKSTTS
ncbi:MAG: hypothetical protein P4M11_13610 [Candidatus Pacebacteria bacterium]|nr:hypothetical protein [Candidatus Paceibacterota bacterium]